MTGLSVDSERFCDTFAGLAVDPFSLGTVLADLPTRRGLTDDELEAFGSSVPAIIGRL